MVGKHIDMTRVEAYAQLLMGKAVCIPKINQVPWVMLEDRSIVVGASNMVMTKHFLTMHTLANGWELYEEISKEG